MARAEKDTSDAPRVADSFRKVLNTHGHAFQRSVWRAVHEMRAGEQANWQRVVYEFPVQSREKATSIDMILRAMGVPLFLVVECKRANPALSDWCFARGPADERAVVYEELFIEGPGNDYYRVLQPTVSRLVYGVAVEVKTNKTGDESGGHGAIEAAVTQVLRGVSGLVDQRGPGGLIDLWVRASGASRATSVILIPTVVTTATLWTSEVDLEAAALSSGMLDPGTVTVERRPWLFYRYHMTPALRYERRVTPRDQAPSFAGILKRDYTRTVAIVNADGLGTFIDQIRDHLELR